MKNNKGFSLVELIIVIAIMAVLIGVLAPQYLKYVEKSRISTDKSTVTEIANAVKTVLADEDVYTTATSGSISIKNNTALSDGTKDSGSKVLSAVQDVVGSKAPSLVSKAYGGATFTVDYSFNSTTAKWTVTLKNGTTAVPWYK